MVYGIARLACRKYHTVYRGVSMEIEDVVMMLLRKITQRIVMLAKHQLLGCVSEYRPLSADWGKQCRYRCISTGWIRCARVDSFSGVKDM